MTRLLPPLLRAMFSHSSNPKVSGYPGISVSLFENQRRLRLSLVGFR